MSIKNVSQPNPTFKIQTITQFILKSIISLIEKFSDGKKNGFLKRFLKLFSSKIVTSSSCAI